MKETPNSIRVWEEWQSSYALLRRETYARLLNAVRSRPKRSRMKNVTYLSNVRECVIELTRSDAEQGSWTVRHATRLMWFKRRISSHWFSDEQQALAFAGELKQKYGGRNVA
jgi:hypothetical protein